MPSDPSIAREIRRLLAARAPGASICPSEAARSLCNEDAGWRTLMPRVRSVALGMARDGVLDITRQGAALDPDGEMRGPIRLRRGPRFPG